MKPRTSPGCVLAAVTLLSVLGSRSASASELALNCYGNTNTTAGTDAAWVLPDDGGAAFQTIHEFPLPPNTGGDFVISAHMIFPNGNAPSAKIAYRIQLDGVQKGRVYNYLLPERFTAAHYVRVVAPDVPPGNHVVRVQAKNTTDQVGQPIYINNIDTFVHAVDAGEVTQSLTGTSTTSVTGSWTDLLSRDIAVGANKMLALGGSVRVSGAVSGSLIELRFLDGSTPVGLYHATVGSVQPETIPVGYYLRSPSQSTHTIKLQIRGGSASAPLSVDQTYLWAQTMPRYPNYWEYESTTPITVSKRTTYQTVLAMANPQTLVWPTSPPPSSFPMYTNGASYATMAPQASSSLMFRQQVMQKRAGATSFTAMSFDAGLGRFVPSLERQTLVAAGQAAGCKECSFAAGEYDVELRVKSMCNENSGTVYIDRARIQFMLIPRPQSLDLSGFSCNVPLGNPEAGHPAC